jgi:hypothetical protein
MHGSALSPAQKPEFSILVQMFNAGERRGNMKHRKLIQKWELYMQAVPAESGIIEDLDSEGHHFHLAQSDTETSPSPGSHMRNSKVSSKMLSLFLLPF